MLQIFKRSAEAHPDFAASSKELMETTARQLIVAVTVLYLPFHVVATAYRPVALMGATWIVTLLVVLPAVAAYLTLDKRLAWALSFWYVGLAAAVTAALALFGQPAIGFLYAILPLLAMITLGWQAGVWATTAVGLLVWWLAHGPAAPLLPPANVPLVVLASLILGVIGWTALNPLTTIASWFSAAYTETQRNMEDARQHRAQLVQLFKDLDQAYYQLERANSALVAARHVAEEAEHFKTEFVTNVSHELRTPLNLIIGFTETMMLSPESYEGVQLPGAYRSDMNAVHHSAQHLLALVDDILDLARIEIGKIAMARQEIDVAALVSEAVNIVRDYIAAKRLALHVEIEPGLPPIWVDRLRIRQVLLNLLVNAARHTEQGEIHIGVTLQGDELCLRVTDTGQGISAADLPKIFEEFRTAEQPMSQWHSGTGLGLPISKKFVELHGGRMGVESTLGRGASFWFTIPTRDIAVVAPANQASGRRHPLVRLGAAERIVVVVHSDPSVISLVKRYLHGYQVIGVAGWEEGLQVADEVKAVAMVVDAREDLPALPARFDGLPVVQCALPHTQRVVDVLGGDDLLVKPVTRHELLAAVDRLQRPVGRVLIVDDDPEVVRLFGRMLRARISPEECLEAYNGEEALHLLRLHKPDLVLLDLIMPEVDGRSVLAQMAADPALADIPVILISATGQDYINLHVAGPLQIWRRAGFELGEVVGLLEVTLDALAKGWQPASATSPAPVAGIVGSPA